FFASMEAVKAAVVGLSAVIAAVPASAAFSPVGSSAPAPATTATVTAATASRSARPSRSGHEGQRDCQRTRDCKRAFHLVSTHFPGVLYVSSLVCQESCKWSSRRRRQRATG